VSVSYDGVGFGVVLGEVWGESAFSLVNIGTLYLGGDGLGAGAWRRLSCSVWEVVTRGQLRGPATCLSTCMMMMKRQAARGVLHDS